MRTFVGRDAGLALQVIEQLFTLNAGDCVRAATMGMSLSDPRSPAMGEFGDSRAKLCASFVSA